MIEHKFGKTSKERLDTCNPDLVLIMEEALKSSRIDFGIAQGARTFSTQLEYFLEGKSTLDPRIAKNKSRAKHVTGAGWRDLSDAADIYIYHPDKEIRRRLAYDIPSLAYVAGVIVTTAERLYKEGRVSHAIRWGGNWDRDGVILQDQKFDDLPHFELRKPNK
jgi:peptidoglycan L-alanyl-D-glutamate endopeptidase CwlK